MGKLSCSNSSKCGFSLCLPGRIRQHEKKDAGGHSRCKLTVTAVISAFRILCPLAFQKEVKSLFAVWRLVMLKINIISSMFADLVFPVLFIFVRLRSSSSFRGLFQKRTVSVFPLGGLQTLAPFGGLSAGSRGPTR